MKHFVIEHTKFLFLGIVICILLIGVWFKLATTSAKPQSLPPLLSAQALSNLVQTLAEDSSASGVVFTSLVGSTPQSYYAAAYGQLNDNKAMPLDAHFYVADASHAMLVTLLLRLQDLQMLKLDDALVQHVSEANHASVITLHNLASQASGLADYLRQQDFQKQIQTEPSRIWQSQDLLPWIEDKPLSFIPGNETRYSAANGLLLGEAIANVTEMSLTEAFKEYLFAPLGLTNAVYAPVNLPEGFSHGYRYAHPKFAFKPGPTLTSLQDWRLEWAGPSKSVIATSQDITRFMHLVMTTEFLSADAKRTLMGLDVPQQKGWHEGLGMAQYLGASVIRGKIHGVSIFVGYIPEYEFSFSVVANLDASRSGANPAELIGLNVLETMYGMR